MGNVIERLFPASHASTSTPVGMASHMCSRLSAAARPDIAAHMKDRYSDIGTWTLPGQLPIVYHKAYNVQFYGLEKLHSFDSCKFKKVVNGLQRRGVLNFQQLAQPKEVGLDVLLDVHTEEYLNSLHSSSLKVAQVTELAPLAMLPNHLNQQHVIKPMRYHVGGSMLAAGLAVEHGWAINLGGGMHHAHRDNGGGWCPYDDIMLAIRKVR